MDATVGREEPDHPGGMELRPLLMYLVPFYQSPVTATKQRGEGGRANKGLNHNLVALKISELGQT